jgi:acyl carrier protein
MSVLEIVLDSIRNLNAVIQQPELENPTQNTRLFGSNGILDSISLVSLILEVEERVNDEFGKNIVLADERAMSQRTSPFRSVRALCAYIEKMLNEEHVA